MKKIIPIITIFLMSCGAPEFSKPDFENRNRHIEHHINLNNAGENHAPK